MAPSRYLMSILFLAATMVPAGGEPAEPYHWVLVTTNADFAPRDGAGALVYQDRMWLLGGWNPFVQHREFFPKTCNNEVWSSQDGVSWSRVKPNSFGRQTFNHDVDWEGRHTAGYAVFQGQMWIIGGDVNQGHYQADVWSSKDGKNWLQTNVNHPVPWSPRALHHTVVHRDKIWVIGGQTMPGFAPASERFYRDLWTTKNGVHWCQVQPREPYWTPRGMIGGSAVFQGRIWLLGGGTYDTPNTPQRNFYNDVWSSADGVNWKCHLKHAPWTARQYHEVAVWDNRLWVLEGYAAPGQNMSDVWYSADGENWQELPSTPWKPRHAASVFVYADALWMVAGNNMESDVWKLVRTR